MPEPHAAPRIITIDGPAGVGKSTLAKRLAAHLGVAYLDTGAMFRGTALALGLDSWTWPEDRLAAALAGLSFSLAGAGAESRVLLNGTLLDDEIRTEQAGMWASNIATLPQVRAFQKQAQQAIGRTTSLVAEGRDMGTVVFPQARPKFFLDASPEVRAARRFLQLQIMGRPEDLNDIIANIRARDHQDRTRAAAPLAAAPDALVIDTGPLTIDEVFEIMAKAAE
ncbi:MAG: (d)CMP kinase [Thermodesulfobacteriota bacterium]